MILAAAAVLTLPGVPAYADTLADAPTAFAGTVYLPDGETVAKAAVVDLSLVGGNAFARTVSSLDGRFSIDMPETDTLVTAALASGGRLTIHWTASDLYQESDVPATLTARAVLGTVRTSAGLAQATGEFVAYLIDTTTNALANALSDPTMVEFRLPDTAAGGIVTVVADVAAAHGIFNDSDMIAGYEDLDDPDLIPPLGSLLSSFEPVLDVAALGGSATMPSDPTARGPVAEVLEATPDGLGLRDHEGGGGGPTCSKDPGTYWWRNDLDNTPTGTNTYVYLDTYSCDRDSDPRRDEVVYKWDGYTGAVDKNWRIWRLKFRSEATKSSGYLRKYPQPTGNVETGNTSSVNWNVGFSYVAEATVGGSYHFKSKKIHPWYWDDDGKLYHVSWISNDKYGSPGGGFNNGGGFLWDVPQGANGRSAVYNKIDVWRCVGHSCDGNR